MMTNINTRVGHEIIEGIKQMFSSVNTNRTRTKLINFCTHNDLRIDSTFFSNNFNKTSDVKQHLGRYSTKQKNRQKSIRSGIVNRKKYSKIHFTFTQNNFLNEEDAVEQTWEKSKLTRNRQYTKRSENTWYKQTIEETNKTLNFIQRKMNSKQ